MGMWRVCDKLDYKCAVSDYQMTQCKFSGCDKGLVESCLIDQGLIVYGDPDGECKKLLYAVYKDLIPRARFSMLNLEKLWQQDLVNYFNEHLESHLGHQERSYVYDPKNPKNVSGSFAVEFSKPIKITIIVALIIILGLAFWTIYCLRRKIPQCFRRNYKEGQLSEEGVSEGANGLLTSRQDMSLPGPRKA